MRRLLAMLAPVVLLAGCGGRRPGTPGGGPRGRRVGGAAATRRAPRLHPRVQAHGTYAGADSGVAGLTVVRADGNTWCLQSANAHEVGPDGTPAPGPCQR